MPGMGRYETCCRLRQVPGLEKALTAAVSAYRGEEDRAGRQAQTERGLSP
jgi:CheY-like chemotaxis protein